KIFLAYASLVMFAGLGTTVSRGAWIASTFALLLFFGVLLFHPSYRLSSSICLAILVGAALIAIPQNYAFQARLKMMFSQGKIDDDPRLSLWQPAVAVWKESPWFGAGPAHFDYRFRKFRPEEVQLQPDRAHNDILNTLADWGLVGA